MKLQVIGKSGDMSSFYTSEKDLVKSCLVSSGFGPSLKEAIEHKDVARIIREITDYNASYFKYVNLSEILGYLIWLFSDIDPTLCQEFLDEAVSWDDLNIFGVRFNLIELDDASYFYFDSFTNCNINKLRFQGKPSDLSPIDFAESYLTLFENSIVHDLTLVVDSLNSDIRVEEFKRNIEDSLEDDNIPKNIKVEVI